MTRMDRATELYESAIWIGLALAVLYLIAQVIA